jgi:hypothetical protein
MEPSDSVSMVATTTRSEELFSMAKASERGSVAGTTLKEKSKIRAHHRDLIPEA